MTLRRCWLFLRPPLRLPRRRAEDEQREQTYRIALARAASLAGGVRELSGRLQVPMPDLTRWLAGSGKPPIAVFLRVVETKAASRASALAGSPAVRQGREQSLRAPLPMRITQNRRKREHRSPDRRTTPRPGTKVVHRHRVGTAISERVSELTYVHGRPVALLDWINLGGVRTPLYVCELDPTKLRDADDTGVFLYEGVTTDPRFIDSLGG